MKKIISVLLLTAMLLSALSSLFTVSATEPTPTHLSTDKTTYKVGEPVLITARSENSSGKDWVGITVKGDKTGAAIYWDYLTDITENFNISKATNKGKSRAEYYDLPAGEYSIILIPNDLSIKKGYDQALAIVDITIEASDEETTAKPIDPTVLKTDKTTYEKGETIKVTASHANLNGTDWVGIIPKGEELSVAIYWIYLSALTEDYDITKGKKGKNMDAYYDLPAGEYTLFIIENDQTLKQGYATAPITLDITIVESIPETSEDTTAAPETTLPETTTENNSGSADTGDRAFYVFFILAVTALAAVTVIGKKHYNC